MGSWGWIEEVDAGVDGSLVPPQSTILSTYTAPLLNELTLADWTRTEWKFNLFRYPDTAFHRPHLDPHTLPGLQVFDRASTPDFHGWSTSQRAT